MLIKRLRIRDARGTLSLDSSFGRVVQLAFAESDTVKKAVGALLKNRALLPNESDLKWIGQINAEIVIKGKSYFITVKKAPKGNGFVNTVTTGSGKQFSGFYELIHQNMEEESLSCFVCDLKDRYSDRFGKYREADRYYSGNTFSALTEGIGTTRMFRSCLKDSMKFLEPDDIMFENEAVYELVCFIDINVFWHRIEEIRDMNRVWQPVFIPDPDRADLGRNSISELTDRISSLKRQIFLTESF